MKSTGVIRKMDKLGRIVLPRHLRYLLDDREDGKIEVFLGKDNESIILKAHIPGCYVCDSTINLKDLGNGRMICQECLDRIR